MTSLSPPQPEKEAIIKLISYSLRHSYHISTCGSNIDVLYASVSGKMPSPTPLL
jgi:hypothetical protein